LERKVFKLNTSNVTYSFPCQLFHSFPKRNKINYFAKTFWNFPSKLNCGHPKLRKINSASLASCWHHRSIRSSL
jgi:hypothetical protein